MRLSIALLNISLLGALTASAATITSFTATPFPGSPFTSTINTNVVGSTAYITNSSVSCLSTIACSGNVLSFSIQGSGSPGATPLSVNIDGTLSGTTRALASLNFTSPIVSSVPFSVAAGTFSTAILNTSVASNLQGTFSGSGTLGLSLAPGQTLTLPSSLSFAVGSTAASVPEPGTNMLVAGGLLALITVLNRRRVRA